jgi:gluconate 5-dehydrogenase
VKRRIAAMLPGIKQFDLTGRRAVITGGSKGLGQAMAAGLASAGADLLLVSRSQEQVNAVATALTDTYGRRALAYRADVTRPEEVDAMVAYAAENLGGIDILINNAGINIRGPIDQLTYEQFQEVERTNVDAVWLCIRAALSHLKASRAGRIINMASTLGVVGLENRTPYASSKGAIVQMTRALALELAPQNILVNAICPGPFLTPMNEPIAETEQAKTFIVGAVALGRWGEMREIQGAAIFLASDAASYVTGSLLTVDGGWTAR